MTPVIPLGGVRRLRPQGVGFTLHLEAAQVLAETILVPTTKAVLVPVLFAQGVSTKFYYSVQMCVISRGTRQWLLMMIHKIIPFVDNKRIRITQRIRKRYHKTLTLGKRKPAKISAFGSYSRFRPHVL